MYATVSYDSTIESGAVMTFDEGLPGQLDMSRTDYFLTFGYRITDVISVFGGWLNGETMVMMAGMRQTGGPGVINYSVQEIDYSEKGPYAGLSLAHSFGDKGTLSLSLAYARLNGVLTQTRNTVTIGTTATTAEGDVAGLSYTLTWAGTLSGTLGYRLGLKATRYASESSPDNPGGITEEYNTVFLGVVNYFQ